MEVAFVNGQYESLPGKIAKDCILRQSRAASGIRSGFTLHSTPAHYCAFAVFPRISPGLLAMLTSSRFALLAVLCLNHAAMAAAPPVPAFSAMQAGNAIPHWQTLKPAPKAPDTAYRLVNDDGQVVREAVANQSMSGLTFPVKVKLSEYPLLRWRWKVSGVVKTADMNKKSGDDYAARVYVMFDYPLEKLSFGTRVKLQLATKLYGQAIPTAALNYIWDNRHPVGTVQANTYTDRARMMVLQSGAAKAGQWVTETRNLADDFRTAFGEEPPDVVAIALASDTDNTGETVTAWYGDFTFLPPPK